MKGKLFAFEGMDGSGKSSQSALLRDWIAQSRDAYLTEWNSSEWVHDIIKESKKKELLTPITFSLIHATDFCDRYEKFVLPLMRIGYVVIADRYIYTAYARDKARGVDSKWIKELYSFAAKPDITFYIRVKPEVAYSRIKSQRQQINPQESGHDIFPELDQKNGFLKYQSMILETYDEIAEENNFVIIDGTRTPREVQMEIRSSIRGIL
jgi:dTMP kinase